MKVAGRMLLDHIGELLRAVRTGAAARFGGYAEVAFLLVSFERHRFVPQASLKRACALPPAPGSSCAVWKPRAGSTCSRKAWTCGGLESCDACPSQGSA